MPPNIEWPRLHEVAESRSDECADARVSMFLKSMVNLIFRL